MKKKKEQVLSCSFLIVLPETCKPVSCKLFERFERDAADLILIGKDNIAVDKNMCGIAVRELMSDTLIEIAEDKLFTQCLVIFLALQQVDFRNPDKLAKLFGCNESGLFSRHLKLL